MADYYKQNTSDVIYATFITVPDTTPTVLALNSAGTTDTTITFGTVTASNSDRTYQSTMTIAAGTPVGHKKVKWSADISSITYEQYGQFYVTSQLLEDLAGIGTGNFEITVNVKDQDTNNVADAQITIHNAADDDNPIYGPITTNASGNAATFMLSSGTYTVRASKAGFVMTPTAITVSATATKNVTGTVQTIPNPSDPGVCRLYLYPVNLDNTDVKNFVIWARIKNDLNINGSLFIKNSRYKFTYNSATTPDSYYFDCIQGETIYITCDSLGLDNYEIDVPASSTQDLSALIEE